MKCCFSLQGVILALVVVAYILAGAAVFQHLEATEESSNHKAGVELLQEFLDNNTCLGLEDLLIFLARATDLQGKGVTLSNTTHLSTKWNFPDSIFFAVTIVTTIGYGNITPTNDISRAFCLVFAILGIPLYLLLLAKIGSQISTAVSSIVQRCCANQRRRNKFALRLIVLVLTGSALLVFLPSLLFMYYEHWSYFTALYATIITLSTIGFGDYVPGTQLEKSFSWLRLLHCIWIPIGLAWFSSIISTIQDIMAEKVDKMSHNEANQTDKNNQQGDQFGLNMNGNVVKSAAPGASEWISKEDISVHL